MWYVLMGIGSSDCDEPPRDSRGAGAPVDGAASVGLATWPVLE